jgi:gliding motility-associated-like protein
VKSILKNFNYLALIFVSLFFLIKETSATHVSGGDITYRCLGNNQYEVTLSLYRDCSGAGLSNSATVRFQSTCGQNFTRSLSRISMTEISQLAPVCLSQYSTTCNNGNVPGMQAWVYRGIVTLPPCNTWTMSFGLCCRNSTTNVNGQPDYFVRTTLNSVTAPCNNSPTFASQYAIPYMCIGQPVVYSYAVVESDGDSLVYSLVSAESSLNNNVGYSGGFNAGTPIPGISINPQTGLVQFLPNQQGFYIVVVQISEYNSAGQLIGTLRRDMQFVIRNCTNIVPTPAPTAGQITVTSGVGTTPDPYTIQLCEGVSFTFDVVFTDPNANDNLTITSNITNVLPGATISTSGTNPLTATVGWTPGPGSSGANTSFSITVRDDACPISGIQTFIYNVDVMPRTSTQVDTTICEGDGITLATIGGTVFNWTVLNGPAISIGNNFSCNPCANPVASPTSTTTYRVTSNLANGCATSDDVTVTVMPNTVNTVPIASLCVSAAPVTLSFGTPLGGTYSGPGVTAGQFNPATAGVGVHTLTYTRFDGICTFSKTSTVEVFALPAAPIIPPGGPFCCGTPAFNLTANVPGGNWQGVPIINTVDGTFNPACANAGTHVISYTITDANNCSNTGTQTYSIINEVVPNVTATPAIIPSGTNSAVSVTYTGGNGLIGTTWQPANRVIDATQGWTNTTNLTSSQLFTANATDAAGCTANNSVTVIVTGGPLTVSVVGNPTSVCPGDPVQLDAIPSGGDGTYTYNWTSIPAGPAIPSVINPTVNPTTTTTYTVTVLSGGASASASVTINTNSGSLPTLGAFNNICVASPPFALSGGNPVGGIYSGNGVVGGNFDPSVAGIGTHTIIYSFPSPNGCIGQATSTIEVTPTPTVTIAPINGVCIDAQPFLLTGGNPSPGSFFGTGVNAQGVFNPVIAGLGTHTVFYQYNAGNNCIGTGSTTITVNSLPNVSIDPVSDLCIYEAPVTLVGLPANGTFSGNGVTGNTFTASAAGANTHVITYDFTDGNGCSNSTTMDIVVNPIPVVTFNPIGNVCIQTAPFPLGGVSLSGGEFFGPGVRDAFFFVPDSAGLGTHTIIYTYYNDFGCFADFPSNVTVTPASTINLTPINDLCSNDPDVDLNPIATPQPGMFSGTAVTNNLFSPNAAGAGTFTLVYEFTDTLGCYSIDSLDVTVFASPILTLSTTYVDTICIGSSVDFLVGGADTYDWTPSLGLSSTTGANITASPIVSTTYTVTGTEVGGCKTDSAFTINVFDPLSVATNTDTTICFGESVNLNAVASGGNGNYSYIWSPISNITNPLIPNPIATPSVSSSYTVTVSDNCGTPSPSALVNIFVNQLPNINYNIIPNEGCVPVTMNFSNSTNNTQSCIWDLGNGVTENNCNFSSTFTTPGTFYGSLTVTDNNGCDNTVLYTVFARPNPIAEFTMTPQPTTVVNPIVYFDPTGSSTDVVEWYWNFDFLGEDTIRNSQFAFPDSGQYPTTLIVTNQFGCSDTITKVVKIDPDHILFIPNAFTPTGDGLNEGFGPIGVGIRSQAGDYRMQIYSRWGELIFESRKIEDLWYGLNDKDELLPNGVYVYQIDLIDAFNRRQKYSGKVTLLR